MWICTQVVLYDFVVIRVNISVQQDFSIIYSCSTSDVNESTSLFPVTKRKFFSFVHHGTVYTGFKVYLTSSEPPTGISPFSSGLYFLFFRSNYFDFFTDAHHSAFGTLQSVVRPLVNAEFPRGRLSCLRVISWAFRS